MKLTFLIADNCLASGIVSLLDTLTIANLWQQKLTSNYKQLFTTELVSLDGGVVNTGGGVQLVAAKALAETGGTEYIVIPPFLPVGSWEANTKKELTSWLRAKHRAGVPIAALCTGSFLLAETGLLDGRQPPTGSLPAGSSVTIPRSTSDRRR